MPKGVDLALAAAVVLAGAFLDYFVLWPHLLRQGSRGEASDRKRVYGIIMAGEWLATTLVAGRWWMLARPWSVLWLVPPRGWRLLVSALAILLTASLWLLQARSLARLSAERRAALRSRVGRLVALVPHTQGEYRWFLGLSVTAGICEELLYRGFLVWVLQRWVGLGWAALVSVSAFAAGHAYQGKDVLRPTVAGGLLQGIALLTQSILPGILVHAMLDVMSGTSGYILLRPGLPSGLVPPAPGLEGDGS